MPSRGHRRSRNPDRYRTLSNDQALSLYIAHRRKLVTVANGIVGDAGRAEDVVQEAFLRFRGAAADQLPDEPVGYLYRVVRNLALDRRRRQTLEDRHVAAAGMDDVIAGMIGDRPNPEDEAIAREELRNVLAAMDELPERTRIVLEMHRFGGCTLKEIAAHLGISVSMAQVLLKRAIVHCQRSL